MTTNEKINLMKIQLNRDSVTVCVRSRIGHAQKARNVMFQRGQILVSEFLSVNAFATC